MQSPTLQTISPFLWFNGNAAEAAEFYTSVFKDSEIISKTPGPNGSVSGVTFRVNGLQLIAFNGGPAHSFNYAISLMVHCKTQEEVDAYWDALIADGGHEEQCGWLKDKYGLSWQVVPDALAELMGDPDPAKSGRVVKAMLQMKKLIIADLEAAHRG